MNILFDTNILIPLEPKTISDIEPETHEINELYKKLKELNYHIFLLDLQKKDIESDKDFNRRETRIISFEKYELLENIKRTEVINSAFPNIPENSHDYVDIALLNAVCANAVSILVTNDEGIHKKAKQVGKEDSVYYLSEALNLVNRQLPDTSILKGYEHPVIAAEKCYNIDENDSFFDSLRQSYNGFNDWFINKCKLAHRDCFTIREKSKLTGICIYKFEEPCYEMMGKIVKICTFKLISQGNKLGELLLKNLLEQCYKSTVDWIYVTAFPDNYICQFFETFGFEPFKDKLNDTEELILRKHLIPEEKNNLDSLEYHIKYGPKYFDKTAQSFLVPITDSYHAMLFPETMVDSLFPEIYYEDSYANAIRKAYICNSNTNQLSEGSILFFYKTHSDSSIFVCGIVEKVLKTSSPDEILSMIGKRTVYKRQEIEEKCKNGNTCLAILFRQTINFNRKININDLIKQKLINGIPQSITQLSEEAKKWIIQQAWS